MSGRAQLRVCSMYLTLWLPSPYTLVKHSKFLVAAQHSTHFPLLILLGCIAKLAVMHAGWCDCRMVRCLTSNPLLTGPPVTSAMLKQLSVFWTAGHLLTHSGDSRARTDHLKVWSVNHPLVIAMINMFGSPERLRAAVNRQDVHSRPSIVQQEEASRP